MNLYRPIIVRKEVDDSHFYFITDEKGEGRFFPSVTQILQDTLPMPYALKYWLGEVGGERAEQKLKQAGDRGTLLHDACERLVVGQEINLKKEFPDKRDQKVLVGVVNWFAKYQPKQLGTFTPEMTIASRKGYAGTLDFPCLIGKRPYIIDWKSSAGVYDSHILQITAYRQAFYEMTGIWCHRGIVHLNPKVKDGYSFHNDDSMKIKKKNVTTRDFLTIFKAYQMLNGGRIPEPDLVEVYPDVIKLTVPVIR